MKCITWNVNGLRSILSKGFADFITAEAPDVVLLQETKVNPHDLDWSWLPDWHLAWNPAAKPGYSGTAILSKSQPLSISRGIGIPSHDNEGRVITAEFPSCFIVSVYTPNSQAELARLPYRLQWDAAFLAYIQSLEKRKPVLFAGDLNVAHKEIDIARPDANRRSPGFSDEERASFDQILNTGFIDVFRHFDPRPHQYSWWSYRAGARTRNIGWRLDYWLASPLLANSLLSCRIRQDITGSDHCPVTLETSLPL
ncbi:MAG: exodeoxyribonuclease-3 [Verrucomicrobia bacterium]|jgi:exodeoxyribonuclease-3|nr:MAG: exodeoxyribonuclease-3 [Verrucomicrobiota bacterium]